VRIGLRGTLDGVTIEIGSARPMPLDWDRWRDAVLAGSPADPIVERYTVPEGWSVTVVEIGDGPGMRVHAFYAVLDQAVHATATLEADVTSVLRMRVRELFQRAVPQWDDEIVALEDL